MRAQNLFGFQKKRRVKTTVRDKGRRVFADLVNRDFTACAANRVLVGDITYLPIADGTNMYLATVIDCFSRKLVGFAIADHMRTELVEEALENASHLRGGLDGAIFHSDHGSVYTSSQFQATCRRLGVTQSMGAVGTSADNSLAQVVQRGFKAGGPQRCEDLRQSAYLPQRRIPVVRALQHVPSAHMVRIPNPR